MCSKSSRRAHASLLDSPFVMLGAIMPTLQLSVVDQFAAAKKKPLVLADTSTCGSTRCARTSKSCCAVSICS